MKRLLITILLFLLPSLSYGAAGDITYARIDTTGWFMELNIAGVDTGGAYLFGLGANNNPANAKVALTVTSQGYDSTGALGTVTRTIWGTNAKRMAYPTQMLEAERGHSPDSTIISIALSDFIYSEDTVVLALDDSVYTQGGVASATTAKLEVTNNSVQAYSRTKVIGNWSWPGFSRIRTTSLTVRAVAYHRSATAGKPVQSVKFWVDDKHGHRDSTMVYRATCDTTRGDAVPVTEYVGTLNLSAMTEDDSLVVNFKAFPRVGDESSLLDTSDGVNTSPTPLYAPQIYIYDANKSLGVVAVVDSATGVDANGATVAEADFNPASPPVTYLTLDGAIDDGANVIYFKQGSYAWTGGGSTPSHKSWVEIQPFPGVARNLARFTSQSGDYEIGQYAKLKGMTITSNPAAVFSYNMHVWLDSCWVNYTGAVLFDNAGLVYATRNDVDAFPAGFKPYSTNNTSFALVRGNDVDDTTYEVFSYTVLGNDFYQNSSSETSATGIDSYTGQTCPAADNIIFAYNIHRSVPTVTAYGYGRSQAHTHGTAVVQNLIETWGTGPSAANELAAQAPGAQPMDNTIFWHNTTVGQRSNLWYNNSDMNNVTPPLWRKYTSMRNNIFDDLNIVTDKDAHEGAADDDRVGNHSVIHGVGSAGNIDLSRVGTKGSYTPKFFGVYSKVEGDSLNPAFVDDASRAGTNDGGGDYRLTSESPAQGLAQIVLLPFDIQGHPRSFTAAGDAGAYDDYVPENEPEEPEPEEPAATYKRGYGGGQWGDATKKKWGKGPW